MQDDDINGRPNPDEQEMPGEQEIERPGPDEAEKDGTSEKKEGKSYIERPKAEVKEYAENYSEKRSKKN